MYKEYKPAVEFLKQIEHPVLRQIALFNAGPNNEYRVSSIIDALQCFSWGSFIGISQFWSTIYTYYVKNDASYKKIDDLIKNEGLENIFEKYKPKHIVQNIIYDFQYNEKHMRVYVSPFGNCQNFTIPNFYQLLKLSSNNEVEKQGVLEFLKFIKSIVRKKLLIVDVKSNYEEEMNLIFKNMIKDKFPYLSSNHSNMIIYILNLENLPK